MQTKLTKSMMLSFLVVLLLSVMTVSSPLKELPFQSQVETTNDIMSESETDTLELTLASIQMQLTSWRHYFREKLDATGAPLRHLRKRDTEVEKADPENVTENVTTTEEPEFSFEDYEKLYYINQTMNLLKQILCYSVYQGDFKDNGTIIKNNNTTVTEHPQSMSCDGENDGGRVNAILERKLRELNDLPVSQLDRIFHNVKGTAQRGTAVPSLSRLCCNVG